LNVNQSYVTIDEHNSEHVLSYKWNNEKRDAFRSGIIAKLPLFNVLLNNIVTNSSDVEELVSHFTRAISDVADPLFKITTHSKGVHTTHSSNLDWFDGDCINALRVYKDALQNFNFNQSHANRAELCNCKKGYKLIVRKKSNGFKIKQSFGLRKLKNQNPKEFWKFFNRKKKQVQHDIYLDDFKQDFSTIFDDIRTTKVEEADSFCQNGNMN